MSESWVAHANDWLSQQLGALGGAGSFGLLFLGGVLASLLPCVYPLYPITAAVLARRQSRFGRFVHPLVYYAGLGGIYFTFGFVAAVTGGSFNDLLRLPAVNLIIGAVLLLLALATAGLLHFPAVVSSGTERGTGLANTFAMGAGAGMLSSACVGPVVVSILVSMAASTGRLSVGVVLIAATKMLLFGLGVGLPFALIGIFGLVLPRSGWWMVRVQRAFAVLIGWFAVTYVFKGLAGVGLSESTSHALLAGIAIVAAATFLAQHSEHDLQERTKRTVLVVAGVIGFFVIGRSLLQTSSAVAASTADPATTLSETEQHGNLTWYLDKTAAYAAAARTGRPVFVDFHGDWCTNCQAFQKSTLSDANLNGALTKAVLLKVRDTTSLFDQYRGDNRFPELKVGLPFFAITDAKGSLLYKTSDFTKSDEMALFLTD